MSNHKLSLAAMPNEMLSEICERLYPKDIKMLRLVSKQMHDCSSPYLVKRAFYAVRPRAHAIFQELYNHPIFGQSVIEIVYDGSQFTREHVENRSPECDQKHRGCHQTITHRSREDREIAAFEYRNLWKFQKSMLASGESWKVVAKGFDKFKKLESIVFTDWSTIEPELASQAGGPYMSKGSLSKDFGMACLPEPLSRLRGRSEFLKNAYAASQPLYGALLARPKLIKQLMVFTAPAEALPIEALMSVLPLPWEYDGRGSPSKMWHLEETRYAATLQKLQVDFEINIEHILDSNILGCMPCFKVLLGEMSNLRWLRLGLRTPKGIDMGTFRAEVFFIKDLGWPNLDLLGLYGDWIIDLDDLLQFLRRHGQTLQRLELANVELATNNSETWVDVFESARLIMPHLRSCSLTGLSEFSQPKNNLNHLPSCYRCYLSAPSDCGLRCKHLNCLESLALGRCMWGESPDNLQRMLSWLRNTWHDWEAMDRGPKTWEEWDAAKALGDSTQHASLRRISPNTYVLTLN